MNKFLLFLIIIATSVAKDQAINYFPSYVTNTYINDQSDQFNIKFIKNIHVNTFILPMCVPQDNVLIQYMYNDELHNLSVYYDYMNPTIRLQKTITFDNFQIKTSNCSHCNCCDKNNLCPINNFCGSNNYHCFIGYTDYK